MSLSGPLPKRRRRTIRIIAGILVIPLALFGLLLAATPFSQLARGVMFSVVFWQDADIDHIHVFPASDIPTSTPSDLPRQPNDTTLEAFGELDVKNYLLDQPFAASKSLKTHEELDQFLTETETTVFLVVKDGVLVHEWYADGVDPNALHTSFSVSKSILSTAIGMAVQDGSIGSLEDPITDYVPELVERDPRFSDITLRHLITMTSGLKYVEDSSPFGDAINTYHATDLRRSAIRNTVIVEEPGKNYLYNNYNPLLLGMALERATGMTVSEYISETWWAPMGAEADASWSMDSFYNRFEKMESGFNARPIDFARFGLMFANGGAVNGVQVIPQAWVEEATTATSSSIGQMDGLEQSYGHFWWTYPDNRFAAQGNLGQYILVSPDEGEVIVRLGRQETLVWIELMLDLSESLD
jgi:CubicO group peptidase (beta-lactamase class C family)